uniref:(northern house mosquito) hypothetical protein n=1 Tax=Culex pipiens TaxID=7175 RepID=A0A8D8FDY0_CULPI
MSWRGAGAAERRLSANGQRSPAAIAAVSGDYSPAGAEQRDRHEPGPVRFGYKVYKSSTSRHNWLCPNHVHQRQSGAGTSATVTTAISRPHGLRFDFGLGTQDNRQELSTAGVSVPATMHSN